MSDCEAYEISISALADGELPAEDLLPTLDHIMECPRCQAFYRDVRALAAAFPAGGADSARTAEAAEEAGAPEEVWRRIEVAAAPALARKREDRSWALRLAATIILVAGLWGGLAAVRSLRPAHPAGTPIEVTLGEDRGRMTEARFVDLTVELLRADSRYHQEMLQVMTAVVERDERYEAPADYDVPLPEEGGGSSEKIRSERTLS